MIALILLAGVSILNAQTLTVKETTITIKGTSTLHDWTMTSNKVVTDATLTVTENSVSIGKLKSTLPVKTLKSGNGTMDDNAYKALNANKFSNIEYEILSVQSYKPVTGDIEVLVALTISGVRKEIHVTGKVITENNQKSIRGEKAIKMTDYKVDPPQFMFGAMKTGNDLVVVFDITLSEKKEKTPTNPVTQL